MSATSNHVCIEGGELVDLGFEGILGSLDLGFKGVRVWTLGVFQGGRIWGGGGWILEIWVWGDIRELRIRDFRREFKGYFKVV